MNASPLTFGSHDIAVQIGRWRAQLDEYRRGFVDSDNSNAATVELDRLLSGFSKVLRGDTPAAEERLPALGESVSRDICNDGADRPRDGRAIADDAVHALDEACKQMYQLAAQFGAIERAAPDTIGGNRDLARLGRYTANDWANSVDCVREGFQEELQRVAK